MSLIIQDSKIQNKIFTTPGVVPTIPASGSTDHTEVDENGNKIWLDTDIYMGELAYNIVDNKLYTYIGGEGIVQLYPATLSGSTDQEVYYYDNFSDFSGTTGNVDDLYIAKDTSKFYYWDSLLTQYVELSTTSDVYWNNIIDAPTSTPAEIDNAVDLAHDIDAPNDSHYTKAESDAKYVEQEAGKGLSENDFTDFYLNMLTGMTQEVISYDNSGLFPSGGTQDTVYIDLSTNSIWVWNDALGDYIQADDTSDTYVVSGSVNSNILTLTRNDGQDIDISLSALSSTDYYVTGATFEGNTLTLQRNDDVTIPTQLTNWDSISATTISGGTYYGDGSNLTGISTVSSLSDLTDVSISAVTDADLIQYSGDTWINVTPETATLTSDLVLDSISATTYLNIDHNSTDAKQGGFNDEFYHLSQEEYTIATQPAAVGTSGYVTNGTQTFDGDKTFDDNVTIQGDLVVNGTATTINTETILAEDNMIVINYGEVGSGVTAGNAGIEVDRGGLTNYLFEFNESTDDFRVGESGDTQAVATREDTPTDNGVAFWDDTDNMFKTTTLMTWDGTDLTVNSLNIANGGNEINSISTNMFLNYNNGRDVYVGYGTSKGDLFIGGSLTFEGEYTLPTTDGTIGQVMTTDGSGNLSWEDVAGGVTGSGTTAYLARWQDSDTLGQSVVYDNGDRVSIGMSPASYTKLSVEASETSVNTYAILSRALTTNSQDNTGVLAQALLGDNNIGVQSAIGSAITNFGSNNNYAYVGTIGTFTQGDTNTLFYGVNNTSNSGDNYGIVLNTTNAGAGNGYIGKLRDGSEGAGKVLTCIDSGGTATWEDVTATAAGSEGDIQYNKTGSLAGSSTFTYSTASGLTVVNNIQSTGQIVSQQHTADAISSATTINWNSSNSCELSLSANTTVTMTNPIAGASYFILIDNSSNYTITWPSEVKWPGGVAPTLTSGGTSSVTFYHNGTSYYGNYANNYS